MTNKFLNFQVKLFVKDLPFEYNYLLKYSYLIEEKGDNYVKKYDEIHLSNKQSKSILGRMIENNEENKELTYFEIFPEQPDKIELPLLEKPKISLEYLSKFDIYQMILPILDGSEEVPFKIL